MNSVAVSTSSPRGIRQNNAVAALQALFAHRRLSRAELARHLGLNRSSSGHIVSELFANGLVREVEEEDLAEKGRARAGRPGILLELEPEAAVFLGIEIGVEHITGNEQRIDIMGDDAVVHPIEKSLKLLISGTAV